MTAPIAQGLAVQLMEDLTPDDVCAVLAVFRDDLERLSVSLREAAEVADLELFRRISHSMAGAAGAVGAAPLETVCRQAMKASAPEQTPPPRSTELLIYSSEIDRLCATTRQDMAACIARFEAVAATGEHILRSGSR
jgi:HPt (histidine-containing phosphotransfer) domain-containing protein